MARVTTSDRQPTGESAAGAAHHKKRWPIVLKAAVVLLVLYALGGHVSTLAHEWSEQKNALSDLSLAGGWIAAAALAYVVAQVCFGLYWGRFLKGLGLRASWIEVLRAYCVGTFGKYVPGKALVVVLRTGLIRNDNISRLSISLSVVYETVTMVAIGSAVAGVCLLLMHPHPWVNWFGAGVAAIGLSAGLHPGVFGRLARFVTLPFNTSRGHVAPPSWYGTFWRWSVLSVGGWVLEGFSCWAVMRAMGVAGLPGNDLVLLTGAVALASIVGFLVLFLPAGIGVRELILIQLLAPRYGLPIVVAASLLLRILWTAVEVVLSAALYGAPLLMPSAKRAKTSLSKPGLALTWRAAADSLHAQAETAETAPFAPEGRAGAAGERGLPLADGQRDPVGHEPVQ